MRKKISLFLAATLLSLGLCAISGAAQSAPAGAVHTIAADNGGHYLISSAQGQSVNVYDPASQNLLYSIRFAEFVENFAGISALAVDDSNLLAACAVVKKNAPGAIYLFDLQSTKLRGVIGGIPSVITSMAFSANGLYLAAGAQNQGLLVYKIISFKKIPSSELTQLSAGEKAALGKLGYMERTVIDPTLALHDRDIKGNITALGFDGRAKLAAATDDGNIHLYDSIFKLAKSVKGKSGGRAAGLKFNQDYSKIAVSYADKAAIDVYAAPHLTYLYSPDTTHLAAAFSGDPAWSADGRFLYATAPAAEKGATDIYKWRNAGEGGWSRLSTVGGDNRRIAPVIGGGLVYTETPDGLNLLDRRYGVIYNEWGNTWLGLAHKLGDVTYEIGGDFSDSNGDSGSYWFPISRLKWPINAFMVEIGGEIHPLKRLEIKGSASHNITSNLGSKMEDSDWVYDQAVYGWTEDIYSESDASFKGYVLDGQARFWIIDRHFSNQSSFALALGAGFTYQNYDWEASDLDQWSPSGVYGTDHSYVSGLVGAYKSQLYMPYLELSIRSRIGKADITGHIGGSPYLWAKDEDDHMLRKRLMTTDAHGYSVKGGFQANYNFTANWFAGLRFNLLYFIAKGTQKGVQYETTSEAAAGYRWDIEHDIKSFQLDSMLIAGYRF